MFKKNIISLFFVIITVSSAQAFDYKAYKPTTINQIIKEHQGTFFQDGEIFDYFISAYTFKYKINVKFTKKLREISPDTKELINRWGKSLKVDSNFIELYKHEFLVQQGDNNYWIPVQEPLLPYMGNEVKVGGEFEIYIFLIGTVKDKWVFLATEFQVKK